MKRIGLIGGMSWESTQVYYQLLNRSVRERLGGLHSADLLMRSFDFAEIEALQVADDWVRAGRVLADAARRLEAAGADCVLLCTNTMHKVAADVQQAVDIPLLHIADATADAIHATGVRRPLLLATRHTMEQDFYRGRLRDRHGIEIAVPDANDRTMVHEAIFAELCRGITTETTRARFLAVAAKARQTADTDSVILGCTEIGLLVDEGVLGQKTFDTTRIHVAAAVDFALA